MGGIGGLVGYELAGVGSAAPVSSPPTDAAASPDAGGGAAAIVPFRDVHQAGIATPAQDRLAFAAFDVTGHDRAAVVTLLRAWTAAAERMTRGEAVVRPRPIRWLRRTIPASRWGCARAG